MPPFVARILASLRGVNSLFGKVPVEIWVLFLAPLVAFAGSEIQKYREATAYPEINKERTKSLVGKWEGYGIQEIDNNETLRKLRDSDIKVNNQAHPELMKLYDDCTSTDTTKGSRPVIWFPSHLTLTTVRTSLFGRTHLQGSLEITPQFRKKYNHPTISYALEGRLEKNEDYIRLDYTNKDSSKKDFGSILLEYSPDGKLCGHFLSYGRISRSIVNGKYIFYDKSKV
jgi:hypothetical protein